MVGLWLIVSNETLYIFVYLSASLADSAHQGQHTQSFLSMLHLLAIVENILLQPYLTFMFILISLYVFTSLYILVSFYVLNLISLLEFNFKLLFY